MVFLAQQFHSCMLVFLLLLFVFAEKKSSFAECSEEMNGMTVEHDAFKVLDQIIEPADPKDFMQIIIDFDVAESGLKKCCKVEWEMAQISGVVFEL